MNNWTVSTEHAVGSNTVTVQTVPACKKRAVVEPEMKEKYSLKQELVPVRLLKEA